MTIYNIADAMTGLVEAIMMLMLCESFCTKKENMPFWSYGVGIIAVAAVIDISNILFDVGVLSIAIMILSFFIMSFLYSSKIQTRAIISVLNFLLSSISEIIVMFMIALIYHASVFEVINIPTYRLMGIIVSKALALSIVNALRLKLKNNSPYMGISYWLLFFLMFISSTATILLIFRFTYTINDAYVYNISLICLFGILLSTFFALYLYEHLAKQAETIRRQEQYEQQLKIQLKHLDDILVTQEQIKKFRHDINNYTIGLQAYIDSGDLSGAGKYLGSLKEKFLHNGDAVKTGNTALDAILSTKAAIARSKGITVETKLQLPERLPVDPIDICIIFGNSLDNAIEACEKTEVKKISITILCNGDSIFCKLVNTAPTGEKGLPRTSKADKQNHGYGLENIKDTLKKYNSFPIIERTDAEFVLEFTIFINQ